jgi:AcrR family transcriptional regulator
MKSAADPASTTATSSHDRMLEAAKQLFSRKGYENTSTIEVVRAAGTSESQLIKHFGSKEGLLESVFNQAWVAIGKGLKELESIRAPRKKLEALIKVMVTELNRDPSLKQLMMFEGRRIRKDGRLLLATEGFLAFVSRIDSILQEMKASGQLKQGINIQAARSALMGAFEGLVRDQILAGETDYPASYSDKEMLEAFNQVLSGVLAG